MGKKNISKAQSEIMWQIRNNVRRGNFSRVSELIMDVLKRDDSDKNKRNLINAIYRQCIAPWTERTNTDEPIPKQYENMLLEYARYEQKQGNTERALEVLESIKETQNTKIRKKVKRQISLINLAKELSKVDDIDVDVIEKITQDIEQDGDSKTYMELISSVFGKEFSIEKLNLGEIEKYMSGKPRKPSVPSDTEGLPVKGSYSEELQVENRMKFFKEELDIEPNIRFCDKGIFAGSILIELKGTDSILVEKIINMYADGTFEPNNYGSSTYILPKDKMLDLIKLHSKRKVKVQLKEEYKTKGIDPIQHSRKNGKWKKEIKEAIEQIKNASKIQTTAADEQVQDEDVETIEKIQTVPQKKFRSKTRVVNNTIANREFLQTINTNLDGILTDEMIEQLTRRTASYSFESIYNNRLKQKIFESLELLDIPAEQMDTEATKIFLVMKMTREDMSKLKSKEGSKDGISEKELAYLTEQYSCYYEDALVALRTGIAQGWSYKQIIDAMKKCILIQDREKVNQQKKTEEAEIPLEPINLEDSENAQNVTNQEETSQNEPITPGIERLLEDMTKNSNGNPIVMKLAKKIQELLIRLEELDVEQAQADNDLQASINEEENAQAQAQDRIEEQKVAREKLAQAIKEEEEASALAEQAINAEQEASRRKQEFEEKQKKIAAEKEAIRKKLEEFIEL